MFWKIDKIGEPLAGLIKKRREKTQITDIQSERQVTPTCWPCLKIILRQYREHLYAKKCHSLHKMDTFPEINYQNSLTKKQIACIALYLLKILNLKNS